MNAQNVSPAGTQEEYKYKYHECVSTRQKKNYLKTNIHLGLRIQMLNAIPTQTNYKTKKIHFVLPGRVSAEAFWRRRLDLHSPLLHFFLNSPRKLSCKKKKLV